MHTLLSSAPCLALKPYVRAFAQRVLDQSNVNVIQAMPASLEQVIEFDFGELPEVELDDGRRFPCFRVDIAGARPQLPGNLRLRPGVESFGIFFEPLGFWQLFGISLNHLVNWHFDGRDVLGTEIQQLWDKMAETTSFQRRVALAEVMLLKRSKAALPNSLIMHSAQYLFKQKGVPRIADVAQIATLSVRQFERRFVAEIGITPKLFAKVTRFQMVLDARLMGGNGSWLTLAHAFGYHDQMHMIKDFYGLSGLTPDSLMSQMGDMRPPALAACK